MYTPILLKAQSTAHSFVFNGQARNYRVYLPVNFNSNSSLPLVLNLHGRGSNGQAQELYTLFDNLADTARCVVVYPDGIGGQWNAVIGCSGSTAPCLGVNDVGFISALIDTIHKNYNTDLSKVYATGMSMGGYMSFRLACELSCRIAAIASVTGLMQEAAPLYPGCNPIRKVPVLQIHGTADSTVPYSGTNPYIATVASTIARWKTINACPSNPTIIQITDINTTDSCTAEKQYYGLCGSNTELIHYKINGGEHTWPDASVNIGITNRDFNATSTIWNFFKQYTLSVNCTTTGLENVSMPDMAVYPNPVTDRISIQSEFFGTSRPELRITDASGREYELDPTHQGSQVSFSCKSLPTGVYFIQITIGKEITRKRIIKVD